MGILSNAHFGVKEQVLDAAVRGVRDALQDFDGDRYGVSEVLVEVQDEDSFVIKLALKSSDASEADVDAERAIEAIKQILRSRFQVGALRERQRELTLA